MPDKTDRKARQEQLELRRLSRLVNALPVFSGFATPDGRLIQSRPETDEAFIWGLPAFAYDPESITQVVDLCERAAHGDPIQLERLYLKTKQETLNIFGRGLLTLTPIEDEIGHIAEIAVSLIDCHENGLAPLDRTAKSRLAKANARIQSMLDLAKIVTEVTQANQRERPCQAASSDLENQDPLSKRLNILASTVDSVSDLELETVPISTFFESTFSPLSDELKKRLNILSSDGFVPMAYTPLMALLLAELRDNAQTHGALQNDVQADQRAHLTVDSELRDDRYGRTLRIHWIEDSGLSASETLARGFGFTLAETLFPQITGGKTHFLHSEDGISWTFEMRIEDDPDKLGVISDSDVSSEFTA